MTCDTGHLGEGEHCVKSSGPKLKRFGSYDVLKIFPQKDDLMNESVNEWINYGGVCRTELLKKFKGISDIRKHNKKCLSKRLQNI